MATVSATSPATNSWRRLCCCLCADVSVQDALHACPSNLGQTIPQRRRRQIASSQQQKRSATLSSSSQHGVLDLGCKQTWVTSRGGQHLGGQPLQGEGRGDEPVHICTTPACGYDTNFGLSSGSNILAAQLQEVPKYGPPACTYEQFSSAMRKGDGTKHLRWWRGRG